VSVPNPPLDSLMIAAQSGDEAAYHVLLKALAVTLRGYFARRLGRDANAEDLVQDTLIAIHERRATYDPQRPFAAWFFAIARYKLIDHLRATRRSPTCAMDEIEDFIGVDEEPSASARLDLERLLDGLSPRSRDIVRTVKIEGQSVAEVSQRSGLSPIAIRVLLHRAVKAMSAKVGNSRS